MIRTYFFGLIAAFFSLHSCSPNKEKSPNNSEEKDSIPKTIEEIAPESVPGMVALLKTEKGDISFELYYEKTPVTVANFVALAEGEMPNEYKRSGEPFFDGLQFHRVEQNFVIQAGCPLNTGTGNPGYQFQDEFSPTLKHNAAGIVSMANSGRNTNGSQFFITLKPLPHLDAKHSVFGKVIDGMDVVKNIEKGDVIKRVQILRNSDGAKNFNAKELFYQRSFETYEAN